MSFEQLARIHDVDVLEQTVTTGAAMAVKRAWHPVRSLKCRVVPLNASQRAQLGQLGQEITHKIRFAEDPKIDERHRLRWKGVGKDTVLRVIGIPYNAHGLNRIWTVMAVARTEDNPQVSMQ